jgi:hypothetical protein
MDDVNHSQASHWSVHRCGGIHDARHGGDLFHEPIEVGQTIVNLNPRARGIDVYQKHTVPIETQR